MGWLYSASWTRKSLIAELTKGTPDYKVLAKTCTGNNLWVVFERTDENKTYRFIALFLMQRRDGGWGYKAMDESCGPIYHNCPLKYLELASPAPDGQYSQEWRKAVREYWENKKLAREAAAKLVSGDVFYSKRTQRYFIYLREYSRACVLGKDGASDKVYRVNKDDVSLGVSSERP